MRWTCRPAELCRLAHITGAQLEYFVSAIRIIDPVRHATKPGSYREYSLTNVYEAALAGELVAAGVAGQRLQAIFAALHASLSTVPVPWRPVTIFLRYVESVGAIATILGQTNDPVHRAWMSEVDGIRQQSQRAGGRSLDDRMLKLLTARRRMALKRGSLVLQHTPGASSGAEAVR